MSYQYRIDQFDQNTPAAVRDLPNLQITVKPDGQPVTVSEPVDQAAFVEQGGNDNDAPEVANE